MARNEQRRQKKLEARRKNKKEQQRAAARIVSASLAERTLAAQRWPIALTRISGNLWKDGIGYAIFQRRHSSGTCATAVFLLDVYCLGVKNVLMRLEPSHAIVDWIERLGNASGGWHDVPPEKVRKLVEDAMGYALSLGLAPHRDCAAALPIFGTVDSSRCREEFHFGKDGKPMFVSGPNDDSARIHQVIETLNRTCSPDGFHFLVPASPGNMKALVPADDSESFDSNAIDAEVLKL